ncbi:MAG: acyl-CoA thioesterase [Mailhella sp.]|nr:acyl-CoA thioesterase [Mailhella sp.]
MDAGSAFPETAAWYAHRVSYGETDAMGVLYHAEYIHIFERSRGELSRVFGYPYKKMEECGVMLPVVEAYCRYRKPARYDDLISVHVGISEWGRASVVFRYEIYDEGKSVLLAEGFTKHACTDLDGVPKRVPDAIKQAFSGKPGAC